MQFSWSKALLKGLQAVGEAALAAALVAGVDYLLSAVDTTEELAALGVPALYVGAVLFVVRIAVNWWKVHRTNLKF